MARLGSSSFESCELCCWAADGTSRFRSPGPTTAPFREGLALPGTWGILQRYVYIIFHIFFLATRETYDKPQLIWVPFFRDQAMAWFAATWSPENAMFWAKLKGLWSFETQLSGLFNTTTSLFIIWIFPSTILLVLMMFLELVDGNIHRKPRYLGIKNIVSAEHVPLKESSSLNGCFPKRIILV